MESPICFNHVVSNFQYFNSSTRRRSATLDRNTRSRGGAGGQISHALGGGGGGGSTSNLVIATSNAHLNLQQPHKSRSERDLTKVTKVRVRLSRDEDANATPKQQHSSAAGRTKMKTTTMIGGAGANDGSAVSEAVPFVSRERVDVVRAPLNWHLGCNLSALSFVTICLAFVTEIRKKNFYRTRQIKSVWKMYC